MVNFTRFKSWMIFGSVCSRDLFQGIVLPGILLGVGLGASACSPHASQALAPQSTLKLSDDVQLYEFQAKEIKFSSSTLFLWRQDVTPEQARTVIEMASQVDALYDELGATSREWRLLERRVLDDGINRAGVAQVQSDLVDKNRVYETAVQKLESQGEKISRLNADLEEAIRTGASASKKDRIRRNINSAKKVLEGYERQRDSAKSDVEVLNQRFAEYGGTKDSYSLYNQRMPAITSTRERIERDVKKLLDGIAGTNGISSETMVKGLVDPLEQSVSAFNLVASRDGSLRVVIEMGTIEDPNDPASRVYSTDNGRVKNAKYTSLGGIYEFDIELPGFRHNNPRTGTQYETARPVRMHWKLSRCNLLSSDQHIRLKGDLEFYDQESGVLLRRGIAKLDSGEKFEDAPGYWDNNEEGIFQRVREARRQLRGR
jgi:hypothetical protein